MQSAADLPHARLVCRCSTRFVFPIFKDSQGTPPIRQPSLKIIAAASADVPGFHKP